MRTTRRRLCLTIFAALGSVVAVRPGVAQEPPSFLASCPPGAGETLEGTVVDRATRVPLAGASVRLTIDGQTRGTISTLEGQFRFCGVPAGDRLQVAATHAGVAGPGRTLVGGNRGNAVVLDVDLGTPSTIVVSVTDESSGEPVEGVTVRLEPGIIGGVTNRDGRAGLGRVPPGDYRLRTDHLAYRTFQGTVFIVPDRPRQLQVELTPQIIALDTLRVRLEAGECAGPGITTISGKVVDRRTRIPLEGAVVSASRFADAGFDNTRVQTDAEGGFILCGMPLETRYRLAASLGDLQGRGINIQTGRNRGAIVLEIDHGLPAFIVMRVTDASTDFPVEGAMIRMHPHPLGGITDSAGLAGFRAIPPGEYDVRVDHIAFASFQGTISIADQGHEEYGIALQPTAISVAPIEVTITGRDPYLINNGFYDRMLSIEDDAYFYDHWDMEPYAALTTFLRYKTWVMGAYVTFVNGRPITRTRQPLNELKFREIRGVEHMQCRNLPPEYNRYVDLFDRNVDYCWAVLIWRGEGRVRRQREQPTDRCATERRAEIECQRERRAGDPPP